MKETLREALRQAFGDYRDKPPPDCWTQRSFRIDAGTDGASIQGIFVTLTGPASDTIILEVYDVPDLGPLRASVDAMGGQYRRGAARFDAVLRISAGQVVSLRKLVKLLRTGCNQRGCRPDPKQAERCKQIAAPLDRLAAVLARIHTLARFTAARRDENTPTMDRAPSNAPWPNTA